MHEKHYGQHHRWTRALDQPPTPSVAAADLRPLDPDNKCNSKEVLFRDNRRENLKTRPPPLPDITCESSLKILGVQFCNNLSALYHIRRIVSESAQTLYALRVLQHHGLSDVRLQEVFQTVIVTRLMYALTAWRWFVTASDIQRVDAFLRRSKRCGFCPPNLPDFCKQLAERDDLFLNGSRHNPQQILRSLIPPPSVALQNYDLRPHLPGTEGEGGKD